MVVMYKNATVSVASETVKKNREGTKIKFFDFDNPLEVLRADVQPNTLDLTKKRLVPKRCFSMAGSTF